MVWMKAAIIKELNYKLQFIVAVNLRKFFNITWLRLYRFFVVIPTYEDPLPGWCNNIYGFNGFLFGIGIGFIRVSPFHIKAKNNLVCADFVRNATLAAIWDKANEKYLIFLKNVLKYFFLNWFRNELTKPDKADETKIIYQITAKDPTKYGNRILSKEPSCFPRFKLKLANLLVLAWGLGSTMDIRLKWYSFLTSQQYWKLLYQ